MKSKPGTKRRAEITEDKGHYFIVIDETGEQHNLVKRDPNGVSRHSVGTHGFVEYRYTASMGHWYFFTELNTK